MKSRAAVAYLAPVREWFLLEQAELTSRAHSAEQQTLIAAHVRAAETRIRAARKIGDAIVASEVLRLAVLHLIRAGEVEDRIIDDRYSLTPADISRAAILALLPREDALPDTDGADLDRARSVILSHDPLYLDRLAPEALEETRSALERTASLLRGKVEPRTVTNVRATRLGRLAAVAVVLAYILVRAAMVAFVPRNVALNKPVVASSYKINPPDGHELVDGVPIKSFGIHTNAEDSPRVTIDLLKTYAITTIKVYNRGDGWYDDCLPLVVELSTDGQNYDPVGRQQTHFGQDPPWVIDGKKHRARYVRLRVDRRSYLALSEVEVFGK